jgi:hypothetical protein
MTKASSDYHFSLHLAFIDKWLVLLKSEVEWDMSTIEKKHDKLNSAYA